MIDPTASQIPLAPGVVLPGAALSFAFMRSSGPGGQNVNKVSSKARLTVRLDDLQPHLSAGAMRRLERIARRFLVDGAIVIESDSERGQLANRRACIERLGELISRSLQPPKKRIPTRPSRASKERRIRAKTRRGQIKRDRGRVDRDS